MPSTHLSLHYHLVFSTKERRPQIAAEWRDRLHAYLGGTLRTLGGVAEAVGGTADHVHILAGLKATHCLADVLRDIKQTSSEWVHKTMGNRAFSWQEGYGGFTVSASNIPKVKNYVLRQEPHHKQKTFQEEYRELLIKSGIDFDERYLW
jgi:REP element-mobilizing transposase RayT